MARSELTVVVVNWNTPAMTVRSVRGLIADGVAASRIVVVDNGSEDGSIAQFQAELPECRLVPLDRNIGYARAANVGARALDGDAYLFVNNDAFIHRPGSVHALLRCLSDDSVGIVAARILNEDQTLQRSVHPIQTPGVALVLAMGLSRFLPNRLQPRWGRHWDHAESREIAAAAATVMLVRRGVWEDLGGFDENSVLYAEDLDLCWRTRNRGWKVWFTKDAEFVHVGAGTTRRHFDEVKRARLVARAEGAMIRRNLSPVSASAALLIVACGLVGHWIGFSAIGHRDAAALVGASLRGHLEGIVQSRRHEERDACGSP